LERLIGNYPNMLCDQLGILKRRRLTEHPDYEVGDLWIERVVAVRADFVNASGKINAG